MTAAPDYEHVRIVAGAIVRKSKEPEMDYSLFCFSIGFWLTLLGTVSIAIVAAWNGFDDWRARRAAYAEAAERRAMFEGLAQ